MGVRKRPYPHKAAKKLKQIRLKLKLSQGEIAALLGIENRAQISAYENGKRDAPIIVLLRYARLAKIPLETIVDDQLSLPK
jgi:transcriptional regulator with XRE-family HTH domain